MPDCHQAGCETPATIQVPRGPRGPGEARGSAWSCYEHHPNNHSRARGRKPRKRPPK